MLGMVVHVCNPTTQVAEAERSMLQIKAQPILKGKIQ